MASIKAFWRSVKLWSWSPDPGIRRRHEPLPDGTIRVVLECGRYRAIVEIGPDETDWPLVFRVLDAVSDELIHDGFADQAEAEAERVAALAATQAEEARRGRVFGTSKGVPEDVRLGDLPDWAIMFAEELRMIVRKHRIVMRPKPAKAGPAKAKQDLGPQECAGK
jgi:hypothetical protein